MPVVGVPEEPFRTLDVRAVEYSALAVVLLDMDQQAWKPVRPNSTDPQECGSQGLLESGGPSSVTCLCQPETFSGWLSIAHNSELC